MAAADPVVIWMCSTLCRKLRTVFYAAADKLLLLKVSQKSFCVTFALSHHYTEYFFLVEQRQESIFHLADSDQELLARTWVCVF